MRTLLVAPLFATLIGCSCPVPPRAMLDGCTSYGCFERTAVSQPIQLEPAPSKPSSAAPKKKPIASANRARPLPAKPVKSASLAEGKAPSIAMVPASSQPSETASGQPSETADSVLKKAKATIAAKMENPTSVEFEDIKRAMRKNTFGQPVDTICGRVKGKKPSGENIGERPFLYLVKEDQAYVVDGNPNSVAATAYRTICTNMDSRGKDIP